MARESQRTKKVAATFLWRHCVSHQHIKEAVSALLAAASTPPARCLTPYVLADLRQEFRRLIQSAERGDLTPYEECKPIRVDPEVYEIRWTDISLPRKDALGLWMEPDHAHFRLYYGEPAEALWFLGLHAHEKSILDDDGDETTRQQDIEINHAVTIYRHSEDHWGIPELPL